MRRWSVALLLIVSVAAGSAGAASDARRVSYYTATAHADFWYTLDYGSNPDHTFNGDYTSHLRYTIRTLVSYDGRRIKTVARPIVDGTGVVNNRMTVWTGGPRAPVQCNEVPTHDTDGARRSTGAQISVGGGIVHLDPGSAVKWPVGCAATESNALHGLPDGKTISGGASVRAFRSGFACQDEYRHEREGRDHSFAGWALLYVRFSPIGKGKLPDARRALYRQVGRDLRSRPPSRYGSCLDPG